MAQMLDHFRCQWACGLLNVFFLDRVGQTLVAGSDPLCPALQVAGELKSANQSFQLRSEKICSFSS